jgi:hypothetical protein
MPYSSSTVIIAHDRENGGVELTAAGGKKKKKEKGEKERERERQGAQKTSLDKYVVVLLLPGKRNP